jgi:pimeloyl-ACP methyl ester carboxylesterase
MATVQLGHGRSLHAAVAGVGTDIVLLHGSLATHQDWLAGPFGRIAELGRAIAVDRPGHGASVRGSADTSIQAHAAQLAEGLGMLGVRRAIIVAHSFGARLALALAERDRRMISHLVLVAPAAFRHFRPFEHAVLAPRAAPLLAPIWSTTSAGLTDRSWVEAVHRMMFSPGEPAHHWRSSYPWDTVLCGAQMVHEGQDFAEIHPLTPEPDLDVSAIDIPTTILAGMADLIVDPISQGRRLAEIMPNARFEPVAGEGHMLHHRRPDILLGAVSRAVSA